MQERRRFTPVEIAQNIRTERRIFVRNYSPNLHRYEAGSAEFGRLSGEDIYQILFELSGTSKEDMIVAIQKKSDTRGWDPFQAVVISLDWPHKFKGAFADAVSVWEQDERYFILRDLADEKLSDRIKLSEELEKFNSLLKDAFESGKQMDLVRPNIEIDNQIIANKLTGGIERKWQIISNSVVEISDEQKESYISQEREFKKKARKIISRAVKKMPRL